MSSEIMKYSPSIGVENNTVVIFGYNWLRWNSYFRQYSKSLWLNLGNFSFVHNVLKIRLLQRHIMSLFKYIFSMHINKLMKSELLIKTVYGKIEMSFYIFTDMESDIIQLVTMAVRSKEKFCRYIYPTSGRIPTKVSSPTHIIVNPSMDANLLLPLMILHVFWKSIPL